MAHKLDQETQSFDLNTAASFLPVMDDTENMTKQLIGSIEMYNSLLDEKSKPVLINFILTTRLSENAKLLLSKKYNTVAHLVSDMNKQLLPKKSFTTLQHQLSQCTQKQKSVDDYGKEIEKLFVDLTITQADTDQNKYRILKPINEKIAIARFASGLQDSNLSIIITARNYTTLKDAIQGAKDEQSLLSSAANNVKLENNQFPDNNLPNSDCGRGKFSQGRGGHSYQFNQRGNTHMGNHSGTNNCQGAYVKSFDNHFGNNYPQRGYRPCSRGISRPATHYQSGNDNRGGNNHPQRGHSNTSRGKSVDPNQSGAYDKQETSSKSSNNRDSNNHMQRGHGNTSRGNSGGSKQPIPNKQGGPGKSGDNRGGNNHTQRGHGNNSRGNSGGSNKPTSDKQGTSGKSGDNRDGTSQRGRGGSCRGNPRGPNQSGTYHNQGNRGKNNSNRGGNNNVARPSTASASEFKIDCQLRFTASTGIVSVVPHKKKH